MWKLVARWCQRWFHCRSNDYLDLPCLSERTPSVRPIQHVNLRGRRQLGPETSHLCWYWLPTTSTSASDMPSASRTQWCLVSIPHRDFLSGVKHKFDL
jgi:hypothetical protein